MSLGKGEMRITVLPDGTIKSETGDMAGPSHRSADDFLKEMTRLTGGVVDEQKIGHVHQHHHSHSHEGETHSH